MSDKKIKIMTISDHPLSPSGVGHMTKNMIEGLLKTGKYKVASLGGAIKHHDYTPMKTEDYGDDWTIYPVDGYGNEEIIRSAVRNEKPDILWFMTDPRFWGWLWGIENEIRPLVPMIYHHVWDNYPFPKYNRKWYLANDIIVTISKVTDDIVANVTPEVERIYLPHAVPSQTFKKLPEQDIKKFKTDSLGNEDKDRFIFFWNNRNARRKQSGTLLWWFKDFLDIVGHDKACLIMHTNPKDEHGQDLEDIILQLGLDEGQAMLSTNKYPPEHMSMLYNMADCTVNISDAEGFGLSTLESLACGTPIIVNMTGGLQEQVTDGKEWFGIGIEPCSQAVIGSQEIPYIYEDRLNKEEFLAAMMEMYNTSKEKRDEMGAKGIQHVEKNYNFEKWTKAWDKVFSDAYEKYGSWENRKGYNCWEFVEI